MDSNPRSNRSSSCKCSMCSQKDKAVLTPRPNFGVFAMRGTLVRFIVPEKRLMEISRKTSLCARLPKSCTTTIFFKVTQILSNLFKISSPLWSLVAKTLDDNPSSVDLSFENSSQICIYFVILRHFDHRTVEISNHLADNIIFC